jgi:hypothetical protein
MGRNSGQFSPEKQAKFKKQTNPTNQPTNQPNQTKKTLKPS